MTNEDRLAERRPWGVHSISSIYSAGVSAGLPDGRWVHAVAMPYPTTIFERLRAAWWVATGRAQAIEWPLDGDLESALSEPKLWVSP